MVDQKINNALNKVYKNTLPALIGSLESQIRMKIDHVCSDLLIELPLKTYHSLLGWRERCALTHMVYQHLIRMFGGNTILPLTLETVKYSTFLNDVNPELSLQIVKLLIEQDTHLYNTAMICAGRIFTAKE